jgi:hypothetical protein
MFVGVEVCCNKNGSPMLAYWKQICDLFFHGYDVCGGATGEKLVCSKNNDTDKAEYLCPNSFLTWVTRLLIVFSSNDTTGYQPNNLNYILSTFI